MLIQTLRPPVAGENFRFNVAGCSGTTNIRVLVNSKPILQRKFESMLCQSMAEIPIGVEGKTLCISAVDSAGHSEKLEYEISDKDPGPHSMLSTSRAVPVPNYSI
jgi:hypothetical protein